MIETVSDMHVRPDDPGDLLHGLRGQQFRGAQTGLAAFRVDSALAEVQQGDQVMGLAAAKAGFEPNDRGVRGIAPLSRPRASPSKRFQSAGRVCVREEPGRIAVDFV